MTKPANFFVVHLDDVHYLRAYFHLFLATDAGHMVIPFAEKSSRSSQVEFLQTEIADGQHQLMWVVYQFGDEFAPTSRPTGLRLFRYTALY